MKWIINSLVIGVMALFLASPTFAISPLYGPNQFCPEVKQQYQSQEVINAIYSHISRSQCQASDFSCINYSNTLKVYYSQQKPTVKTCYMSNTQKVACRSIVHYQSPHMTQCVNTLFGNM